MNLHLTTMTQTPTKQLQKINIRHYTFTRSTRLDHTQVSGRVVPSIDIFSEKKIVELVDCPCPIVSFG